MAGPSRITAGLLTDPAQPLSFSFDGRALRGLAGDTLASALLANGVRVVGRSFKYHRPRGIVTAGPEEPCALVDVIGAAGREPNQLATTLELLRGARRAKARTAGRRCASMLLAINDLVRRFLPAGFYYKTFMCAGLGLGAAVRAADPPRRRARAARGRRRRSRRARRDRARHTRRAGGRRGRRGPQLPREHLAPRGLRVHARRAGRLPRRRRAAR